jgi:phosphohistidine swiveling domain-containing protein
VLFGADPLTGRRDRLVVAAVPGGPAALVSGEVDGWTAVLGPRGRVQEIRSTGATRADGPPALALRRLARLAARANAAYGGPQDIEWALEDDGTPVLLQARPITTLAATRGAVFGPGPVAETFPDALAPLEQDLWLDPMRDGLREALRLAGATPRRRLERSTLVVAVDGMVAADLETIGADTPPSGLLRKLDPRPPARRLRAAWRVGRLRAALPALGADVIRRVDGDLLAVPTLSELSNLELLAVLDNGRRALVGLHGHEALAGLLIPSAAAATTTGASLALSTVAQARGEGVSFADLVERDPVVLALVPPRIGPTPDFAALDGIGGHAHGGFAGETETEPDPAAVIREALRLRVRWLQELTGRAAWELGRRLVGVGVLPTQAAVRLLRLDELDAAVRRRTVPGDLAQRHEPNGMSLPARFRLSDSGTAVAVPTRPSKRGRRRGAGAPSAVGAGGGTGSGPVHVGAGDIAAGSVLLVPFLDPRLAPVLPRLGAIVSETGSPLSHLAILAREHGVPIVVGMTDATTRWSPGEVVVVDGHAGTVELAPETAFTTTGASS